MWRLPGVSRVLESMLPVCFLVATCLLLRPVVADAQSVATALISHVDTAQAPEVRVLLSILDDSGNPVALLSQSELQVYEDGTAQTISDVSPATDSMAIVLAIDTSGSMGQGTPGRLPIDQARLAAEGFVTYVKGVDARPGASLDQIAIMSFNEKPSLLAGLSTDHNAAINAIRGFRAEPKWTSLYDAAYQAVRIAGEAQLGQRAVVLLTDGWDEGPAGKPGSTVTFDDVVNLARQHDVPIYPVGLGNNVDQKTLARLATLTTGSYSSTGDPTQLSPLFQHIASQLKSKYVVTFETGAPAGDHTIRVVARRDGTEATDQRSVRYPEVPPVIQIVEPKSGSLIQGDVDVIPGVGKYNQRPIVKVEYRLGGQLLGITDSQPFIFHLTHVGVPSGPIDLEVRAFDSQGLSGTDKVSITIIPAPTASPSPLPSATPIPATETPTTQPVPTLTTIPTMTIVPPAQAPLVDAGLFPGAIGAVGLVVILIVLAGGWLRRRARQTGFGADDTGHPVNSTPTVTFASLIIVGGPDQIGRVYYLPAIRVHLGREGSAGDIILADPTNQVSRDHAVITREGDDFYIQDLGSLNGTRISGVPIVAGESVRLTHGLEILLGNTYRLRFDAGPGAGNATPSRTRPLDGSDTSVQ
jgi:VWFA-related protein